MYHMIDRLHTLYGLLQDEQSKEIFLARFAIDMEPSVPHLKRLVSLGSCEDWTLLGWSQTQTEALRKLNEEHKKILLYGAGNTGRLIAKVLQFEHIDFYGFCGNDAKRFPDGLFGKPVLHPDELVGHGEEYYVVLTVIMRESYREISEFLQKNNYPEELIFDWVDLYSRTDRKQYFEFPELYRRGTAFIDGGCYDCSTSYRFAEWCGGAYSSIVAFEPDPGNYAKCCYKEQVVPLPNFQLIHAGLASRGGVAVFDAQNTTASRVVSAESGSNQVKTTHISIQTVAIDDIVGDRTVGFIKLDIEGSELDALHGAKNTIIRDKPLLAICVYHLRGDVFAIMDYLHKLLPEYRFMLRHYGVAAEETVLYASVDL